MRIWARRSSSSAQKVFWTLAELGVPHEQINAGQAYGIVDDPGYLEKNPNGLVPTLEEEDGFVLWESNAIVRYLADQHGRGTLAPEKSRRRAISDSWMDWATTTLEPPVTGLWARLVLGWEAPHRPDNDALVAQATRALAILARTLGRSGYVAGPDLTIGDVPLGVLVNRWFKLPIEHPDMVEIRLYHDRLSKRAAYLDHVIATRPLV